MSEYFQVADKGSNTDDGRDNVGRRRLQNQISLVRFSPKDVSKARHQSQIENISSSMIGSSILHQIVVCVIFNQNFVSRLLLQRNCALILCH